MKEQLKPCAEPKKIEAALDLLFSHPLLEEKRASRIDAKIIRKLRADKMLRKEKNGAQNLIFVPLVNLLTT